MEVIVGGLLVLAGNLLQPITAGISGFFARRRAKDEAKERVQQEALSGLATSLEEWRVARFGSSGMRAREGMERTRILTYRVADDRLRTGLEELLAAPDGQWDAKHGDAVRRLGEVMRGA